MRKLVVLFISSLLLTINCLSKNTAPSLIQAKIKLRDDYKIVVNNKLVKTDTPPVEYSNIIFIPIRFCAEYLNADIKWNNEEKVATLLLKNREVILKVNELKAIVNNKKDRLLAPPFIYNNRIMIPLKFTATSLGAKVKEREYGMEIDTKSVGIASYSENNEPDEGTRKQEEQILIKPQNIKHKKGAGAGWAAWLKDNILGKIKFVFIYEFRVNPLNKIMAPAMLILWGITAIIYFIKIRKKIK